MTTQLIMVEFQWQNQSKKLVEDNLQSILTIDKVSWIIESQENINNSSISHLFQDQRENLNRKDKDHVSTVHQSIKVLHISHLLM